VSAAHLPAVSTLDASATRNPHDLTALCHELLTLLDADDATATRLEAALQSVEAVAANHPQGQQLQGLVRSARGIAGRLAQHRENERGLRGVVESAQALTELKELDDALFEIVERGRRVIGSDVAWLAALNPEDGHLCVLAVSGVFSKETKRTNTPAHAGVAGHVLRTRSPFATADYIHDPNFEHSPETDIVIQRENLRSVIAVPLLSGAEVTGILIVGDRYSRHYPSREVSILAVLAAHASVALRNARAYDLTRQALQQAEEANQRLQQQAEALERAADAHGRLTSLLARGAPLKDLIEAVALSINGQVTYVDAAGITVCSATPPGHTPPEVIASFGDAAAPDFGVQSAMGQSRVHGRAVPLALAGRGHAVVAAVTSRDELFGALVVLSPQALAEQSIRILERGATAVAVLQLSADKSSASLDRDVNLTLRALVESAPQADDDLMQRLERHGIDTTRPMMLALVAVERSKVGYAMRRLASMLAPDPRLVTEIAGRVVLLLNWSQDPAALEARLHALMFDELSLPAVAAVSGPHTEVTALAEAHGHLGRALRLLHLLNRSDCVVHEAALRLYAVLFQHHSASELDASIDAVIGPLIEHDRQRQTSLLESLLAYLDHLQNARATADALGIHVNTLHNRLETIRGVIGRWDLDGRVADIHLALRLHRLKQGLSAAPGAADTFRPRR